MSTKKQIWRKTLGLGLGLSLAASTGWADPLGRMRISDFRDGSIPAQEDYRENWGDSSALDGWHDDGDVRLIGDFRNLGYDQVMFINNYAADCTRLREDDTISGWLKIVDYSGGVVPGSQLYHEAWGQNTSLAGLHDAGDVQLVGDFSPWATTK